MPPVFRPMHRTIRVGVFTAFSGSAGVWGPSSHNAAILAASEINAGGGILGREIELAIVDTGAAPAAVARRAAQAVATDEIDVVVGGHISSAVREAVTAELAGRVPYIYTSLYEGGAP